MTSPPLSLSVLRARLLLSHQVARCFFTSSDQTNDRDDICKLLNPGLVALERVINASVTIGKGCVICNQVKIIKQSIDFDSNFQS